MVNSNCSRTLLKIIGVGIFATAAIQIYAVSKITSPSAAGTALIFQGKDPFELARSQSFGFFYDITNDHWNLLHDMYVNHRNHRHPDRPLIYNPAFETREERWLNSASAWYNNNYEPNFSCPFEKRVGMDMNGDGPKWVCDPHRIKKLATDRKAKDPHHRGCVIYSIGSSGNFNFELGMQEELGEGVCEFHIFDMGDYGSRVPKELKRAYYHQWGLKKQDPNVATPDAGQKYYGLLDTIKLLGHEDLEAIDVFKIDCEKCEWDTYMDWLADGVPLLHQIQVEVHGAPGQNAIDFFDTLEQAGFLTFHKEPNIWFDSNCIEYAFVKVDKSFLEGKKDSSTPIDMSKYTIHTNWR